MFECKYDRQLLFMVEHIINGSIGSVDVDVNKCMMLPGDGPAYWMKLLVEDAASR